MGKMKSFIRNEEGQGMTEYIIIVAIIAIAGIAIFTLFGDQIRDVVYSMGETLGGQQTQIQGQMDSGEVQKTMGNW